jgi:hypothetical protein
MTDLTRLQIFTVGVVFGFIAAVIVIAALPGGEFVETASKFSPVFAAYVLLLGAALAYRAAMARIEHDKHDVKFRRSLLAQSMNREYEARLLATVGRVTTMGLEARERGQLGRESFVECKMQLAPSRKRMSALIERMWERMDETASDAIPQLTERAIRAEGITRNLTRAIKLCETEIARFDVRKEPIDAKALLGVLGGVFVPVEHLDDALKEAVKKRIAAARSDFFSPLYVDSSIFDPPGISQS